MSKGRGNLSATWAGGRRRDNAISRALSDVGLQSHNGLVGDRRRRNALDDTKSTARHVARFGGEGSSN